MLRLRKCILTQLLPSSSASPISHLSCLFSAAVPAVSPNPSFAVEEYLVATCGLTRPQAAKASAKLSHLKSPAKPDAVLAFLAGLGLSAADVAALVAKDPLFLCAGVERTLYPVVVRLTDLGLARPDIARLVSLAGEYFRRRFVASRLPYFMSLFGSYDNLLRVLKNNPNLLGSDLDRVVKPNIVLLQECGLGVCDIAKLCIRVPWMLSINPERVQAIVASAERLGVPRGSRMFRHALHGVAFFDDEKITAKVELLKKTFRWSDAEVGIAVSKAPIVLKKSKESLHRRSEFLISEVGLEPGYIAYRPAMLSYSLEGRMRPRYYVVKFLKENGLLKRDLSYFTVFKESEKAFKEMFIHPHKEAAPHLGKDYDAACKGEVPTNFRFM
ncbi:transcription termination factor MTERF15, mitochondrial-like [Triticum dicoccoides]|uniref:transcription termination factor MTERF15, mitochondrial-like n=1 Tax=Triticum dicoccoides TaxID=85692 RepID=UPI00188DE72A|nr:transcription termination factor MTERF15, mitochondrial-like [Triticum dicoccoides]